jgi:hypothetical protein
MHKQILFINPDEITYIIRSKYGDSPEIFEIGFRNSDRILQFPVIGWGEEITRLAETCDRILTRNHVTL